jgi:CheY-like chemotaxis protein
LTSGTALAVLKDMKSVLIADDDTSVLALTARALPEYRITTARNGFEALALAGQLADCDLLITDYLMPMMTGDELAGRLRAARPTVKTLLVTSHTAFVDIKENAGLTPTWRSPFAAPSSAKRSESRDMVWFFERGFEILTCEARKREAAYELVVRQPDGTESVQSLNTASQLIEQIAVVPQAL